MRSEENIRISYFNHTTPIIEQYKKHILINHLYPFLCLIFILWNRNYVDISFSVFSLLFSARLTGYDGGYVEEAGRIIMRRTYTNMKKKKSSAYQRRYKGEKISVITGTRTHPTYVFMFCLLGVWKGKLPLDLHFSSSLMTYFFLYPFNLCVIKIYGKKLLHLSRIVWWFFWLWDLTFFLSWLVIVDF